MSDLLSTLEFEVKDISRDNLESIRSNLLQKRGVYAAHVNEKENKVFVETNLPSAVVQKNVEREFKSLAILRGIGTSTWNKEKAQTAAAVSIISNFDERIKPIHGVVRFVQLDENNCAIDGTIDGIKPGYHAINICENGDISNGCESTGNHFNPYNKKHGLPPNDERHAGDLGNVKANSHDVASFRLLNDQLKVWDIIGRSFCVYQNPDYGDGEAGKKVACGIIARSAGLFDNAKKICLCSGKTLWDERDLIDKNSKI